MKGELGIKKNYKGINLTVLAANVYYDLFLNRS